MDIACSATYVLTEVRFQSTVISMRCNCLLTSVTAPRGVNGQSIASFIDDAIVLSSTRIENFPSGQLQAMASYVCAIIGQLGCEMYRCPHGCSGASEIFFYLCGDNW